MKNNYIRGVALCCITVFFFMCLLPFSPIVFGAEVFDTGITYDSVFDSYDINDSSVRAMSATVSITALQPVLIDTFSSGSTESSTFNFLTSSGTQFTGTISQSGNANITVRLSESTINNSSGSSSTTTGISSQNYFNNLKFSGIPTSISGTTNTVNDIYYIYDVPFDLSFRVRNYMNKVYQFNYTTAQMYLDFQASAPGTMGGELELISAPELYCYKTINVSNKTTFCFTATSDFIYANRITLSPGMFLNSHYVIHTYVISTAPLGGTGYTYSTISNVNLTGYAQCREYDGVNPSVLWNLYYVNQKLDTLNSAPSNSQNVTNESVTTQSSIDTVHNSEQSYFQQNQQNLQATGIGNFSFDSDTSSGLYALTGDFTAFWNSLGDWKFIYIFVLMMGLATFLIRHQPVIRPDRSRALTGEAYRQSLWHK